MTKARKDFNIQDEGTVILLYPITVKAQAWVEQNLGGETAYYGDAIVVEGWRLMNDILDGFTADGLTATKASRRQIKINDVAEALNR